MLRVSIILSPCHLSNWRTSYLQAEQIVSEKDIEKAATPAITQYYADIPHTETIIAQKVRISTVIDNEMAHLSQKTAQLTMLTSVLICKGTYVASTFRGSVIAYLVAQIAVLTSCSSQDGSSDSSHRIYIFCGSNVNWWEPQLFFSLLFEHKAMICGFQVWQNLKYDSCWPL